MEMTQKAGAAPREAHHVDFGAWTRSGLTGGVIAGLTFAAFEMIIAALIAGNFFGPLRMISATVLGPRALSPEVSLATASAVGVIVHMVYSIAAGAVIGLIIAAIGFLNASKTAIVLSASVLGLLMWLINFYVIAPAVGWVWFPERASQLWQGFVAHTFLYGSILGWYLAAVRKQ
jgi:hypothetical protein